MTTKELVYIARLPLSDQILMASYLELVQLEDGRTFGVTDVLAQAHVEFYDPSVPAGINEVHSVPRIAYLAPGQEGVGCPGPMLRRPINLPGLREVLSHASRSAAVTACPNAEQYKLENWLALLAHVEAETLPREIQGLGNIQIIIFPMEKVVSINDPESWRAKVLSTNRKLVTLPHIDHHVPAGATTYPFDRFRWDLCMTLTRGNLLPCIAGKTHYSLAHWPDFGVLGANPHQMKLSALFRQRELSVAQAAMLSNLSANVVIAFINGCAALKLLKDCPPELMGPSARKPARPMPSARAELANPNRSHSSFGGWIGKIRTALGL